MKRRSALFPILFLTFFVSCNGQNRNKALSKQYQQLEQNLLQNPKNHSAWQELYFFCNENYLAFSIEERAKTRALLEKTAIWSSVTLATTKEPGVRIILHGHVINQKGDPVANASLHVFQTDSHGYYTPLDSITHKMGEPDARINGFLQTDQTGFFEIITVRPASYPQQYKGRTIPQHIHINASAGGYRTLMVQAVFTDDPAMDSYWLNWAIKNGYPVIGLDNVVPRVATLDLILQK